MKKYEAEKALFGIETSGKALISLWGRIQDLRMTRDGR
jgi:hypothetical protein